MINKRKLLYGVGSIIAIAAPLATVIACGNSSDQPPIKKGTELKKGDHVVLYWNSTTKSITFEIDLGDTDDRNTAHTAFKDAEIAMAKQEFVDAEEKAVKGIAEKDITMIFSLISRGKTAYISAKGDKAEDMNPIIALEKCGWPSEDAKFIIS